MKSYEKTLTELKERLIKELGNEIDSILVYGSVARNEAREESDIDVLIVFKAASSYGKGSKLIRQRISEIAYDIDLENGTLTSIIYATPGEIVHRLKYDPFIRRAIEEGKVLYDDGTIERIHV